jgi:hypothetical protein
MRQVFFLIFAIVGYSAGARWDTFDVCDQGTVEPRGGVQKVFPAFPRRWHGSGVFQEIGNPPNRLIAEYWHDRERGIGREIAKYVDKLQLIYFDFRTSETSYLPASEIWIELNRTSGVDECYIPPFPIPNLFTRTFWITGTNMTFRGQCQIGGELSDCWLGAIPGSGPVPTIPLLFCNLASRYPEFRPVVKQVLDFRFYEYWGEEQSEFTEEFIKAPANLISSCKVL